MLDVADRAEVQGEVAKGFEPVRAAFIENFARRNELGAACCVYRHGEKVVDLWGGVRNEATGEPWEEDTMVLVHSATKGLSAMTLAVAHSHMQARTVRRVREGGWATPIRKPASDTPTSPTGWGRP